MDHLSSSLGIYTRAFSSFSFQVLGIYGRRQVFSGPIVTLKVFEDNVLVREFLEEKGNGRVLVVDGGASLRCAILGGNPVVQAQNNGWAGIVVNGCIRDVDEINGCDIGVRALASHPMKANKKGIGEKHSYQSSLLFSTKMEIAIAVPLQILVLFMVNNEG
ncbi:hypothetical protein QYF36_016615 [Acer negundo]|nr:hypothetical protein QYF36_016615 [Acer negundo]